MKSGYVYFMMSPNNEVIYIGVTNDLKRRVYEHQNKLIDGFTRQYNVRKLVYFEAFEDIRDAIYREKQIKAGSRIKKLGLISIKNPFFEDLYEKI